MSRPVDWRALTAARGLDLPADEVEVIARRQESLEEAFRPLADRLTPDQEPAALFRADVEGE